jgi:hypothetical protein
MIPIKGYTTLAKDFLDAATVLGGLSAKEMYAIDYLSRRLKNKIGIENIFAAYPIVGGDAARHSLNFIDPALYPITWGGTVSHTSNGVQGDGSSGYGDTGIPINTLSAWDSNIGAYVYSRTDAIDGNDFGTANFAMNIRNGSNEFVIRNYGNLNVAVEANGSSLGGFYGCRFDNSNAEGRRNGNALASFSYIASSLGSNFNIALLCTRNAANTLQNFSARQYGIFIFLKRISNSDELHTSIQNFQTILGRNV